MNTITEQFNAITKLPMFEIEVLKRSTNLFEHIIFDIEIDGNKLKALHESLSQEQQDSDKIPFVAVEIDEDFTLDSHLENLYDACITAIIDSEWFELTD